MVYSNLTWVFLHSQSRQLGVYDDKAGAATGRRLANGDHSRSSGWGGGVRDDVGDLFGDIKKLIFTEWGQKQQYLDITKVDTGDTDNPLHEVRWGPRAKLEVKRSAVLQIVSNMYKVDPRSFKQQFEAVVKEDPGAKATLENRQEAEEEEEEEE